MFARRLIGCSQAGSVLHWFLHDFFDLSNNRTRPTLPCVVYRAWRCILKHLPGTGGDLVMPYAPLARYKVRPRTRLSLDGDMSKSIEIGQQRLVVLPAVSGIA